MQKEAGSPYSRRAPASMARLSPLSRTFYFRGRMPSEDTIPNIGIYRTIFRCLLLPMVTSDFVTLCYNVHNLGAYWDFQSMKFTDCGPAPRMIHQIKGHYMANNLVK